MKDDTESQYDDLLELEGSSLSLRDIESIAFDEQIKRHFHNKYGSNLFSTIFLTLTHEKYEEQEARALWNSVNEHMRHLTKALGRNPGITVAALDYLFNVRDKLSDPVIIEEEKSEFVSETTTKDELTQLYLRSVFDVVLDKEVQKSIRKKSHLSLLMIDIDDFKEINDVHGHLEGDAVLTELGKAINRNIREMDLAARYGGEELAIIMPDSDVQESLLLAERIREIVSRIQFDGFSVTVSIGIGHIHPDCNTAEKVIGEADAALYEAKRNGKNQVVVSDSK